MRARLPDLAVEARARGAALAAFTCYDLTTATGVVTAAQDAESPVVLLVSSATAGGHHGLSFIRALRPSPTTWLCRSAFNWAAFAVS